MDQYKDLKVWVEAYKLSLLTYKITKTFPKEETFGLTNQVRRSASSVAANIAEGKGRFSQKELARFLLIARGSLFETEYHLALARDLSYLGDNEFNELKEKVDLVGKLLNGLIRSMKEDSKNEVKIYN